MPVPLPHGVAEALAEVKVSSWEKKKERGVREGLFFRVGSICFSTFTEPLVRPCRPTPLKNARPR